MSKDVAAELRFDPITALRGENLLRVLDVLDSHPVRVSLRPEGPTLEAATWGDLFAAAAAHEAASLVDRHAVMRLTLNDANETEADARRLAQLRGRGRPSS